MRGPSGCWAWLLLGANAGILALILGVIVVFVVAAWRTFKADA